MVGDTSLLRIVGTAAPCRRRSGPATDPAGQTYGWDCVIALGAAWFLDDGEGSEGTTAPSRARGLDGPPAAGPGRTRPTVPATLTEVCGLPGGLIANPR